MDKNKALQKLLNGKATKKEIEELKQAVANGEISIGGDMNRSVVIIGSGNKVELTAEALGILKPETTTEEPVAGESPYMGLRYFDISDADLFYGREALTAELLKRVKNETFLAIVGASGSGKSSVARAGFIPAWKKENEKGKFHIITPTTHPLESLAVSLTKESESVRATSMLMDDLKNDSRSLRLYVKKTFGEKKFLLLVDQFEEAFTLCKDDAERKAFIENLLFLADENGTVRVVITLRADFYHHCFEYEGLRLTLEKHQANLGAMTQDELREAITAPAKKNGWDFQPGLVDLILQDIGSEPGALPLLSHALLETWKRRQGHTLTLQGYHEAGGVKKAITQTAEGVYDKLSREEQAIARNIFLRLTELGEGTQDTRRRVKMDELGQTKEQDAVAKVLKTLTDARLVTTEENSAEVAHEALIREWGTLRKWLDEDRDSLRIYRNFSDSAQDWNRSGRDDSFLIHRGSRLDDILLLKNNLIYVFTQLEQEYLMACLDLRNKEQYEREQQQKDQRQHKLLRVAYEVSTIISSVSNLDHILDQALKKLSLFFEKASLCVLLYNPDLRILQFAPISSKYYIISNPIHNYMLTLPLHGKSIACRVARDALKSQSIYFENIVDVELDPDYLQLNLSTKAEMCISLMNKNGLLIGVLVVEHTHSFHQDAVELIRVIAPNLALAIERAKLIEDLEFKSLVATRSVRALDFAHRTNNRVGLIKNLTYLMKETYSEPEKFKEFADKIIKNATEISDEVANLATSGYGKAQEVLIDNAILRYLTPVTERYNIELESELNAGKTKVLIHIEAFNQVMQLLVQNASQAMSKLKNPKVIIQSKILENSEKVEIIFQDFGAGISDSIAGSIFQHRITTKNTGGYGLLLVRQLIEDMHGTIRLLESEPGKGAAFSIILPIVH